MTVGTAKWIGEHVGGRGGGGGSDKRSAARSQKTNVEHEKGNLSARELICGGKNLVRSSFLCQKR